MGQPAPNYSRANFEIRQRRFFRREVASLEDPRCRFAVSPSLLREMGRMGGEGSVWLTKKSFLFFEALLFSKRKSWPKFQLFRPFLRREAFGSLSLALASLFSSRHKFCKEERQIVQGLSRNPLGFSKWRKSHPISLALLPPSPPYPFPRNLSPIPPPTVPRFPHRAPVSPRPSRSVPVSPFPFPIAAPPPFPSPPAPHTPAFPNPHSLFIRHCHELTSITAFQA